MPEGLDDNYEEDEGEGGEEEGTLGDVGSHCSGAGRDRAGYRAKLMNDIPTAPTSTGPFLALFRFVRRLSRVSSSPISCLRAIFDVSGCDMHLFFPMENHTFNPHAGPAKRARFA